MKKLTLIIAALALTLSLSQCKKQDNGSTADGVRITLTAGYGNDGAKTDFTPASGSFVWTSGTTEWIYVGGSNHDECLGKLSGTGTGTSSMTFDGTLTTTPDEGETLYFFYMGKGRDGSAVSTLDFSTQDGTLGNLTNYHIAVGDGSYTSGTINYAATLNMIMAIAYFDVSGFVNASSEAETVYVHGENVYSTATVNYRTGTITGDTKGYINVGTADEKYVALIPSVTTETAVKFDSGSKTGSLTFNRGIQAGKYYANSSAALSVTANALMDGTLPGLFSVSPTKKVRFSKGNLQYIGSAGTSYWKFAENQWDYLGTTTEQNSDAENVDRDLFGWGTSGYNHGAVYYQPWSTSSTYSHYYAYGNDSYNLYDQTGQAEWGYNAISNGGNAENSGWRTLTRDEYVWVIQPDNYVFPGTTCRATTSGIRFAVAYVNGVNGVILLPDDWSASYYPLNNTNTSSYVDFDSNTITTEWTTLEQNGAVFLPCAGWRNETMMSIGTKGHYWSSKSTGNSAYKIVFGSTPAETSHGFVNADGMCIRSSGCSVRLVRDI